jgi:hypothetical protein
VDALRSAGASARPRGAASPGPRTPPTPAVGFGLAFPLRAGSAAVRARDGGVVPAVLLLLLLVLPIVGALVVLLRGAAGTALVGLLAGSPADAPGVVVVRPDAAGLRMLVLLHALAAVAVAGTLGAGLLAGAGGRTGTTLRAAARRWARWVLALAAAGLLVGLAALVVALTAVVAGRLRFQLTGVVLVLGLGPLLVVALRLSLAPAMAAAHGLGRRAAVRRAWTATRGEAARLTLAFAGLLLAVGIPVAVLARLASAVLDAVAAAGLVAVSPLTPGWWTLALVVAGAVVAATLWGLGARAVADDVGP